MAKTSAKKNCTQQKQTIHNHSKIALSIALLFNTTPILATTEIYAPWLTQIGLNQTILSNAKWGYGVNLAIVDTGIADNPLFFSKGQVSNRLSSCAATSFSCTSVWRDDEGHGTAVAAIASGTRLLPSFSSYGGYNTSKNSVVSVAPSMNLISQKVLNEYGFTYSANDVALGIVKSVDAGAAVVNLSLTASHDPQIVNSVNYAASKGVFIVWAGGNDNTALTADTTGLTPEAIQHFIFAGSVNYNNVKSSFSNTPGSAGFYANGIKTPYAYRWMMAPGEDILAPNVVQGTFNDWSYWSGTSMSAPIVSASLGLLINTWPILKTQGTAADLLLATTTNLGTAGVDATYGSGLLNLQKAFQPYGDLTITGAKGSTYTTKQITGSMITSGALGKLSKVKSKLKKYNAFDDYNRNFKINMSNMIKSSGARPIVNALPTFKKKKAKKLKWSDGFSEDETTLTLLTADEDNAITHLGEFGYNPENDSSQQAGYMAIETGDGSFYAYGYDYSVDLAYQQALYGESEALNSLDFSENLSQLAEGGKLFAYGLRLAPSTRFAMTWHTNMNDLTTNSFSQTSEASNLKLGISHQFNEQFTGAVSFSLLNEKNGLLGSQYQNNALLSFNQRNQSASMDLTAIYKFNQKNSVALEATLAKTKGGDANGLFVGTTDIISQAFGASFVSKDIYNLYDQLTLSIKQPLRVVSGKSGLVVSGVDALGYATYRTDWLGLSPDGREIDYSLTYETPMQNNQYVSIQASYRQDLLNEKDNNDIGLGLNYRVDF